MRLKNLDSQSHREENLKRERIDKALAATREIWSEEMNPAPRYQRLVVRLAVRGGMALLGALGFYGFASQGQWAMACIPAGLSALILTIAILARKHLRD